MSELYILDLAGRATRGTATIQWAVLIERANREQWAGRVPGQRGNQSRPILKKKQYIFIFLFIYLFIYLLIYIFINLLIQ